MTYLFECSVHDLNLPFSEFSTFAEFTQTLLRRARYSERTLPRFTTFFHWMLSFNRYYNQNNIKTNNQLCVERILNWNWDNLMVCNWRWNWRLIGLWDSKMSEEWKVRPHSPIDLMVWMCARFTTNSVQKHPRIPSLRIHTCMRLSVK